MRQILSSDYNNLQKAFDALDNGDTLNIVGGTYTGITNTPTTLALSNDGRGIYVLTSKKDITINCLNPVTITPYCVTDGIFLLNCVNWTFSTGLTVHDAYKEGLYVNGVIANKFFEAPLAHTAGIHLANCSYITVDSPTLYNCEMGFHPENGDHVTLLSPDIYSNGQAGIRQKDCKFLTILGGKTHNNGLFTNIVHQNPMLAAIDRASCQGFIFYGGDDLVIDELSSYNNLEDAIMNYQGNIPRTATRVKITNCKLQSNNKNTYPMVWSYINMYDQTWEFSNNIMWNNNRDDFVPEYLRILEPNDPRAPFFPPQPNPLPFSNMENWLKILNPNSIGNYILDFQIS